MIGRVKKWLGIEGVKLVLDIPDEVRKEDGAIRGQIHFQSLNSQTVTSIRMVLIERFSRGRGQDKLVDEYQLGDLEIVRDIDIPAGEEVSVDFELPFGVAMSEMDELQGRNFFMSGLVKAAKYLRSVKSDYRLEAEAKVKGVALNPFDKKPLVIK